MRMRVALYMLLALTLAIRHFATADVVHLKSGVQKVGTVVTQDEKEIVLEITRRGLKARIRIPLNEVERVERLKPPQEEYQERLQALPPNDAQALFDLGLWCEKKGLTQEARDCFQKAVKLNPNLEEAGHKLGLVRVSGQWKSLDEVFTQANERIDAGKAADAIPVLKSVYDSAKRLDSLKRREVLSLLCRCYELTASWPRAQECYDELIKCYGTLTPQVAVIRVKQRLLKEHPDGMVPESIIHTTKPPENGKPDIAKALGESVKAMGEGMKAVADLITLKPTPKVSLSDPKVMDAAIRHEAERILKDAEDMAKKADLRALSERFARATNPLEHLQRLVLAIPNLMRLGVTPTRPLNIGQADEMYAKAIERALDADLLVRDISRPLRITITKKRLDILDEFIAQARIQIEQNPLYIPPPPPNAPPDPNAKARLLQLSPTTEQVAQFRQAVENLEKLYNLKAAVLKPMSDDLLAESQKNEKDMEPLGDIKKKLEVLTALANDLKEYHDLEAKMQEAWSKAQLSHPSRFTYNYDTFQSPDGLYHFRDKGKSWRYHSDVCMNYCDEAMSIARKRRAIISKYPERPQTQAELNALKNFIVQVYNYKVGVMAHYNKKGGRG